MKIEYLEEGAEDCPLIRLFDYTPEELDTLIALFRSLADQKPPFSRRIEAVPVDGTALSCTLVLRDEGVVKRSGQSFELRQSAASWLTTTGLAESLCGSSNGYQWLAPSSRGIQLLLSADGCW
jgi:hypothetical protein